jgi:argininosuccinate lyase
MPSEQIRAPGSKPGENMLWGGRFTGLTHLLTLDENEC